MIKKILSAFLMIFVSGIANANIHIDGKVARKIVLEHIDQEHQVSALQEYNVQLKATGNFTMSAAGLYKVCTAAGWDIVKPEGKTKCEDFVKALVAESDYKYYEVCGKDKGKSGGTEYCVDNVFYSLIGGILVTMLQADGLAKEYVRLNYKGDDIECSSQTRKGTINPLNDYVKCTSKLKPIYYEFKFDDVVESLDVNITSSVEKAICEMHGVDYIYATSSQTSTFSTNITFYPAKCKTSDANLCAKINESMKRFGYTTKIQNSECVISENTIHSESQLRTAFGIDNLHFRRGYQLSSYAGMRTQLCEYIKKNANTAITSCECNYNRTQLMKGSDNNIEDVLTCYANGQPIDFLFDDLSEHSKTVRQGNMEAFACSVLGGEYQGKTCFTPDKKLCEQIAAATLSECPECAKAYYDETLKSCVLPNATKANNHQKKVNIGLIIGGAVVGAGIIIYTGGTGFAAVAVTLETIGAGMELGAQIHIDGVADEFFMKANNCNDATCAESILKEYFQYISRMTNDLQSGEKLGIDSKMATLVEMLPDDSQFLIDVVAGCYETGDDNFDISKCDDGTWNDAQIIRAVGIGLQFTSVFASVGKWVLGAGRVQKIAGKTPSLTKALGKKIPGIKGKIAQKLSKGEKVLRSDGKAVKMSKAVNLEYTGKLKGWKVASIESVKISSDNVNVYKFIENNTGKTYYLKSASNIDEIKRTKRAYEILNNQSDIVHTVRVIEDDQQVLIDFTTKHNLPQSKGHYWFVMEEMPSTKGATNLTDDMSDLMGKPITLEEQEEVLRTVKKLNDGGIYHGDLWSNMTFKREPNGKLRVDIIDFESWSAADKPHDIKDVEEMFELLVKEGGAEYKTEKGIRAVKQNGVVAILDKSAQELMSQSKSEGKIIGFLDEGFMPSVQLDDFIKDLEKEGYRIERAEDHMGKRTYKVFSDSNVDIEALQKQFIAKATDKDKNARLAALGLYYDSAKADPDSWYKTYRDIVTEYLVNDPDVAEAQRNWHKMSEWERYKFTNQTNRKIRHIIDENPLPVSYHRPPQGANASYGTQRLGTKATEELKKGAKIDYDEYYFDPNANFEDLINSMVHENYHYSQDIGKSETPKWLLDYNIDNYNNGKASMMEYFAQPIERGVRPIGQKVADALGNKYTGEKLEEMHEIGIELQKIDDEQLKTLGKAMVDFIDNKTNQDLQIFRQTVNKIKYDRNTPQELIEYISSFDNLNFWDRCRHSIVQ